MKLYKLEIANAKLRARGVELEQGAQIAIEHARATGDTIRIKDQRIAELEAECETLHLEKRSAVTSLDVAAKESLRTQDERIAELETEVIGLTALAKAREHVARGAEEERDRLRAALRWYADGTNYSVCPASADPWADIMRDCGYRARAALQAAGPRGEGGGGT